VTSAHKPAVIVKAEGFDVHPWEAILATVDTVFNTVAADHAI
jgi:hypothetical protein